LFYLQSGKIKITVISELGKEAVVAILGPWRLFFGEGLLAGQPKRTATSTAMDESTVVEIPKAEAIACSRTSLYFSAKFIAHLLARNIESKRIWSISCSIRAEKRLARILLLLANFGKEGGPQPVIGKNYPGYAGGDGWNDQVTVSFFMNKFRRMGFIEYNGTIKSTHRC